MEDTSSSRAEIYFKYLSVLGAIISFVWAVFQWKASQSELHNQRTYEISKTADQHRIEAQKPFLEKQLALYSEVVHISSFLATSTQSPQWTKSRDRFWEMYWGDLATVENKEVAKAMVSFGEALNGKGGSISDLQLQQNALELAHAVRSSLDASWGIKIWTTGSQ